MPGVLLVDSDPTHRSTIRRTLSDEAITVTEASTCDQAIDLLEHLNPDLIIISDRQDTALDRLCRQIRHSEQGSLTPILLLADSDPEREKAALDAEVTAILIRPLQPQSLINQVRCALRSHQRYLNVHRAQSQLIGLGQALESSSSEILVACADTLQLHSANRSAKENLGFNAIELYTRTLFDLVDDCDDALQNIKTSCQDLASGAASRSLWQGSLRRRNGSTYPAEGELYRAEMNGEHRIICVLNDETVRQRDKERMHQLAYYDTLTNLPNRTLFLEHFRHSLALARRQERLLALLFVDLDNFKYINDTMGHSAGDMLLRIVADRLRKCVRESDFISLRNERSLARFGGDEFAIFLPDIQDATAACQVADRMVATLSRPCMIQSEEIITTPSIGLAMFPDHGQNADALLHCADTAMYEAKRCGKGIYQMYDKNMLSRRLQWAHSQSH